MSEDDVKQFNGFLAGAITMGYGMAALFFFKFFKESHDRLFAIFAAAFAILAINRVALTFIDPAEEARHYFYMVRFAAYMLILWAIIDKNRAAAAADRAGP